MSPRKSLGGDFKTPEVTGKRKRVSRSQPPISTQDEDRDELEFTESDVLAFKATPVGLLASVGAKATRTPIAINVDDEDELSPESSDVLFNASALPESRRVSIPILPLSNAERRPAPSPDRRPPREERGRSRTRKSVVSLSFSQSRSRLSGVQEEEEQEEEFASGGIGPETGVVYEATNATAQEIDTDTSDTRRTTGTGTDTFDGGTSAFLRLHAAQSTKREVYEIPDDESSSDDELTPQPRARKRTSDIEILADASNQDQDEDMDELSPPQGTLDGSLPLRTPLADTHTNTRRAPRSHSKPRIATPLRKKQKTADPTKTKTSTKGGPTVSITVYRRTSLPDDDPLGVDPDPQPTLAASDILSQIATELITKYISEVPASSQRSNTSKKTLRHRVQALQQFRDNLEDSLRTVTFAQIGMWRFEREVRAGKKMKRELREELMGRRREREGVEVEIDRVRRELERSKREVDARKSMADDLERIKEAARRGRERAARDGDDGEIVKGLVGSAVDATQSLGLLGRVKAFNSFLEGTAGALEGRSR